MRFSDAFLEEIRSRLPVSQVVGRKVALKKKGREYSGLSPFKVEKTPSFFVNDQKGFYHCFASGEHGDIFTFLMKTEGLAFPEAVERLAQEAGLQLPRVDPAHEKRSKEAASLHDVMAAAAEFFQQQLAESGGAQARAYLTKRGMNPDTIKEFGIGYAPRTRFTLKSTLARKGFSEALLIECGLLINPDSGGESYDRFRDRIMIPIHDYKGRVIAFGGRAIDPEAQPKYLNSPETPLFHKGSILFNFHRARQPAHDSGAAVVVEGYLDAITVFQSGIKHVVANLGTALTEQQIDLLWRLAPTPIICFDGDKAGEEAAYRTVDRILPKLVDGRSIRFAVLEKDKDPDELIKEEGRAAFDRVLAAAQPLSDVVWNREVRSAKIDTPEGRAALERSFRRLFDAVADATVRRHYQLSVRVRLSNLFWEHDRSRRRDKSAPHKLGTPDETKLARAILGMAVEYPELCEKHWESFRTLPMNEVHSIFRDALIDLILTYEICDVSSIYQRLDPKFFLALNQVHGENVPEKQLERGHRLYELCPILKRQPPVDFAEQYMLLFIDLLSLRCEEFELKVALHEYELAMTEMNESRLLSLSRSVTARREAVRHREHELEEVAAEVRRTYKLKIPSVALAAPRVIAQSALTGDQAA